MYLVTESCRRKVRHSEVKGKGNADISLPGGGSPPQSYGTSLAMWDHLPPDTSECAPPNASHASWYSIYYPGGMEGWVEPATFRSRVRRRTTAPTRQPAPQSLPWIKRQTGFPALVA